MQPEQFDTDTKPVQYAMFAKPNRYGTRTYSIGEWN